MWQQALIPYPTPDPLAALSAWTTAVFKENKWDHKWQIRDNPDLNALANLRGGYYNTNTIVCLL